MSFTDYLYPESLQVIFLTPTGASAHAHANRTHRPVKTTHHDNIHAFSRANTLLNYLTRFFSRGIKNTVADMRHVSRHILDTNMSLTKFFAQCLNQLDCFFGGILCPDNLD